MENFKIESKINVFGNPIDDETEEGKKYFRSKIDILNIVTEYVLRDFIMMNLSQKQLN